MNNPETTVRNNRPLRALLRATAVTTGRSLAAAWCVPGPGSLPTGQFGARGRAPLVRVGQQGGASRCRPAGPSFDLAASSAA